MLPLAYSSFPRQILSPTVSWNPVCLLINPRLTCSARLTSCIQTTICSFSHKPALTPKRRGSPIPCSADATRNASSIIANSPAQQQFTVIALGNVCLDIVYPMPLLPQLNEQEQKQRVLEELTPLNHPLNNWEVGGNCNFAIAAARLGLSVDVVGHWGTDTYGAFLEKVLLEERIQSMYRVASGLHSPDVNRTLVCFVMVDPQSKHAFCSKYDLGPAPLFADLAQMPAAASQAMVNSKAIFTNAFIFDEVPNPVVEATIRAAIHQGSSFFFDPGPRCFSMMADSRRSVLEAMLDLADVVLMTEDEAQAITGKQEPKDMVRWVLERPASRTHWVVVKLGAQGAMLGTREDPMNPYVGPPLMVQVQDTVGCGDSFAAGVMLGHLTGSDLACTLMLANAVGAATAMGRGAGRNVANAERVLQLLQQSIDSGDSKVSSAAERAIAVVRSLTGAATCA